MKYFPALRLTTIIREALWRNWHIPRASWPMSRHMKYDSGMLLHQFGYTLVCRRDAFHFSCSGIDHLFSVCTVLKLSVTNNFVLLSYGSLSFSKECDGQGIIATNLWLSVLRHMTKHFSEIVSSESYFLSDFCKWWYILTLFRYVHIEQADGSSAIYSTEKESQLATTDFPTVKCALLAD